VADPLIGKFFSSYKPADDEHPYRQLYWNGQIRGRVRDGLYMVKLMNAMALVLGGEVSFDKQIMVSLEDMKDWEFSDSPEAWRESFNAYARMADGYDRTRRAK